MESILNRRRNHQIDMSNRCHFLPGRILVKIIIDIIILIKIRILVDFIRNIVSTRIPIISTTRILIHLFKKF